jgi:broad specificity phosphatase PhoE
MPAIILGRHGPTEWTSAHRIQGHTDIPLSLEGQDKVTRMAVLLKRHQNTRIRRIVCSDLSRAYQTALVVCVVLDIPMTAIIRDDRLRECRYGKLEGLTVDEARRLTGEPLTATEPPYPYDYTPWGGEDYLAVLTRHLTAIIDHGHELLDCQEAGLLIIGHGRGLGTVLHHFKQPPKMKPGTYRLLQL